MAGVVPTQIVGFIDEHFPFARNRQEFNVDLQFKDRVSALLRLVAELPEDLLVMIDSEYNRFVLAVETMRSTIELWNSHGVTQAHIDRRLGSAITNLRATLIGLEDQQISTGTAGLAFIHDAGLRESIRADVGFAKRAFFGREWKAATVLGGAAIEALLLWALSQQSENLVSQSATKLRDLQTIRIAKDSKPEDWTLDTYKHIARDLDIVDKAIRTSNRCTASTAHTALAAMERLIEAFSRPGANGNAAAGF